MSLSSSSSSTFSSASTKNGYNNIVAVQRDYFDSGATAQLSTRKVRLSTLKKLLEENTAELAHAVEKDLHKKPGYTQMELLGCLGEIDYVTANLEAWSATEYVSKTLLNAMDEPSLVRQPLGVVLIIGPWNYPLELVVRPLIPALAAGNTAVIKPSEVSSHTAAAIAKIFSKYFPPEVVTIVSGGIQETTLLLKERFDHIFYTGSTSVGKIVMTAAAQHLTPVTLELGGKSPAVVLDDAKMEVTAARLAWGKWTNAGQTCVAPDYILVTEENKQRLVDEITKQLTVFYGKDIKESKDYGRIINRRHFDRLSSLLNDSRGTIVYSGGDLDPDSLFFPPTIVEVSRDDALMRDEIFGPILPIITIRDLSEAVSFINSKEHPLAAYIFTTDHRQSDRFVQETRSGGVCINDVIVHIIVDTLPFGGVGHSGMGSYHGKFGFDTFTHQKPVLKRGFFGESLMAVRYPPMTDEKVEMFKGLTVRRQLPRCLNWLGRIPYWFCD